MKWVTGAARARFLAAFARSKAVPPEAGASMTCATPSRRWPCKTAWTSRPSAVCWVTTPRVSHWTPTPTSPPTPNSKPHSPARFFRILGQKWVKVCNIRRDWRTATLRHSPHDLSSYHKWRKGQRFVGVFVHHGSRFGLGDGVKVTTVDILIRCDGVAPW